MILLLKKLYDIIILYTKNKKFLTELKISFKNSTLVENFKNKL